MKNLADAIGLISNAKHLVAFTGAGISVESGIPPFRGENGVWNKYNPEIFDLQFYVNNPSAALELRKVFYDVIEKAKPNKAHLALAELEKLGLLRAIITQNIDNLHFIAGNKNVIEFHGNTRNFVCMECGTKYKANQIQINTDQRPLCPKCNGLLKPDFVFFNEPIPSDVYIESFEQAKKADVMLVIGTTGIVYPAGLIPQHAKENGAKIVEINIEPTVYTTNGITDVFLQGKATDVMSNILQEIKQKTK